jgi:hypothetical protein
VVREDAVGFLPLRPIEAMPRRLVLKGTRELRAQGRKASISAFSVELRRELPGPKPPPPPRRPPAAEAKPKKKSVTSFAKLPAVLQIVDDEPGQTKPK